jgi:hypothetical protein
MHSRIGKKYNNLIEGQWEFVFLNLWSALKCWIFALKHVLHCKKHVFLHKKITNEPKNFSIKIIHTLPYGILNTAMDSFRFSCRGSLSDAIALWVWGFPTNLFVCLFVCFFGWLEHVKTKQLALMVPSTYPIFFPSFFCCCPEHLKTKHLGLTVPITYPFCLFVLLAET